jgi:DNA replication protein
MKEFSGFLEDTNRLTPIPTQFFSELLGQIDHLGELKVTLFALGFIGMSGDYANCLRIEDFTSDANFMASMGDNPQESLTFLNDGLERAVQRGSLIKVPSPLTPTQLYYFINTPRGRSAAQALNQGATPVTSSSPGNMQKDKPNIFNLYEANIGPLTPMIAETLREAEKEYPLIWIGDAMKIAVQNNIRRWRYVEAILKSWKEEGRDGGDQQHAKEDYRRYVKGKFGQFGKR